MDEGERKVLLTSQQTQIARRHKTYKDDDDENNNIAHRKKMFNLKTGHINCQLKRKFGCAFPSNSFWLFFLSFKKFPHKNVFVFHIFWFGISFTLVLCHSFWLGLFVIFFICRSFSFLSFTQTFAISFAVLFLSYLSKNWKKIAKVSFIWTHAI